METVGSVIRNYVEFLNENETEEGVFDFICQPLNDKKAVDKEIEKTEEKLSIKIPEELKYYYSNEANGTEVDIEEYPSSERRLDIFRHQKIIGISDFFEMYWDCYDPLYLLNYQSALSEEESNFINDKNKEFFVCAADWDDNFIGTFVFDRNHNFYRFLFDQDLHLLEYLNDMINGSEYVKKNDSFARVLSDYLEEKKEDWS